MLQVDTPHSGRARFESEAGDPTLRSATRSPLHEFTSSPQRAAAMADRMDGPDAIAELDAGRASIARLRSALMDTLDDMQGMVAGVQQYDRTLCAMLARIDRAKAAARDDVATADSVMDRLSRRTDIAV